MMRNNNIAACCLQANLQHAKSALVVLTNSFEKDHQDLGFIQEPYDYNQQIKALTGELLYEVKAEGSPRHVF